MIGGLMLFCGVGAMVLIAWWSLERDDLPAAQAASGLLALRTFSARRATRQQTAGKGRGRRPAKGQRRQSRGAEADEQASPTRRQTVPAQRELAKPAFNRQEMADIAREIEDAPNPLHGQKPGQPSY